jgi:hypothetical protein
MKHLLRSASRLAFAFITSIVCISSYAQSNFAVSFDGTDDYVSTNFSLNSYPAFTIEAWINYSSTTNNTAILGQNGTLEITFNNSRLYISIQSHNNGWVNTYYAIDASFSANAWNHIAFTGDGSSLKIYINGGLKASLSTSWDYLYSTSNKFNIGGYTQSSFVFFSGKMDEVRVWNTARTQAEIKANMFNKNLSNSASGLAAYYGMNSGSGTTATNSCTNTSGIDGTLTNGPAWVASPVQFAGNALHFDQVNDRILAPLGTAAGSNVTMELWLYHEGGTGTDHLVIVNGVMGANGYAMYINTQHKLCVQFNGVNTWNTNVVISANQWTHLALVITTTGFILYKNGVSAYSNTGTPNTPTTNFIIGFNTVANGQPFDGMIDEVRIWNTARTQTEIQNNMNSEIAPSTSGLALYYTFNQGIAGGANTGLTTLTDQTGNNNGTLTNFSLSGAGSNFVTQNTSLTVLPLKWLSFTVQKQNETVLLQWRTASETATREFVVEYSSGAINWQQLSSLQSAGNSDNARSYNYTHDAPVVGINYYRIKQLDIDGNYTYSEIRSISLNNNDQPFKVLGNPLVSGKLQVQISQPNNQRLKLFTSDGRLIWTRQFAVGIHSINVSQLSKGTYVLQRDNYSEKILLQ